jgi:hypothetical protein
MVQTAFKPSEHGFNFGNTFRADEIMEERYNVPTWAWRDSDWGLCGGMCFAALDTFFKMEPITSQTNIPNQGDNLFVKLVRRQEDAEDSVGLGKIIDYQFSPNEGHMLDPRESLGHQTLHDEWPNIKAKLDSGIPTTLCLIRADQLDPNIGKNHMVVAYGYTINGNKVEINVYDPNFKNDNDIIISFKTGQANSKLSAVHNKAKNPRGFIHVPYDKKEVLITDEEIAQALEPEVENLEWIWVY